MKKTFKSVIQYYGGLFTRVFFENVLITVIMLLLLTIPVMLSWDEVFPEYFGVKEITYLDALSLNILITCLFKLGKKSK